MQRWIVVATLLVCAALGCLSAPSSTEAGLLKNLLRSADDVGWNVPDSPEAFRDRAPDDVGRNVPDSPEAFRDRAPDQLHKLSPKLGARRAFIRTGPQGHLSAFTLSGTTVPLSSDSNLLLRQLQALPEEWSKNTGANNAAPVELLVEEATLTTHSSVFGQLDKDFQVYLAANASPPRRVIFDSKNSRAQVEREPGLWFELKQPGDLAAVEKALGASFHSHDVDVISLFDDLDYDIHAALDKATMAHRRLEDLRNRDPAEFIRSQPGKLIVLIGHIEGNSFVVRRPDSTIAHSFEISSIESAASEANTTVVLLGCSAARVSKSTGPLEPVRDIEVAQGLSQALQARDYGGFLASFATPEAPFLIKNAVVEHARYVASLDRTRLESDVRGGTVRVTGARFFGRANPFPLQYWELLLVLYALAVAGTLLVFPRTAWRAWTQVLPAPPVFRRGQHLKALYWRAFIIVGFFLAAPITLVISGMRTILIRLPS